MPLRHPTPKKSATKKPISGQPPNLLFLNNFELDRFNVFEMKESLVDLPDMDGDRNKILKRVNF